MVSRDPQMEEVCPQTGISDVCKDLKHAIVEIVSKHGLHNAGYEAAHFSCRTSTMTIFWRQQSVFCSQQGFYPNLSAHPNQPFRSGLIRHLLQLMQDPDIGPIDIAESGFHTGVFEPIR